MAIDLKDLEKLLKLCRKQGVSELTHEGISIKFGELPTQKQSQQEASDIVNGEELADPFADFPEELLTDEQLSYYANGGAIGQEPWKSN